MILKILIVAMGLTISTYLFKKAAGTLSIRKLNLISYTFYLFVLQTYIGTSLVFLGDRKHYTMSYILHEESIPLTFFFVLLTAILFPLVMIITHKVLGVKMDVVYDSYLKKETTVGNEEVNFYIIAAISSVCILMMILLFMKLGYIPLFKLIHPGEGFNFNTERIIISNTVIINEYVKNILVLSFIPIMSYIAFTYTIITKKVRWGVLFAVLFVSSIFVKTYNFAKTPVVFYLFTFILIYIFLNNGIKKIYMYSVIIGLGLIIILMYKMTGFSLMFSIHSGPIGRTIFTQVGTLIYHFDLFPTSVPFLMCRSLGGAALRLIAPGLVHVRSAKVVMAFYGSRHVYDGIAGVMNAFFIGEAYANFGSIGVIFSIIYMGVLFGGIYYIFTKKLRKNALNLVLFAILTSDLVTATQGGFFDFIYSANLILIVLLFIFINYTSKFIVRYIDRKKIKA